MTPDYIDHSDPGEVAPASPHQTNDAAAEAADAPVQRKRVPTAGIARTDRNPQNPDPTASPQVGSQPAGRRLHGKLTVKETAGKKAIGCAASFFPEGLSLSPECLRRVARAPVTCLPHMPCT